MFKLAPLLALPLNAFSAAVPSDASAIEARQANDCLINRVHDGVWVEGGMTRNKVRFSAEGTDVNAYCELWRNDVRYPDGVNNLQCWTDGNQGELDVSFARGPAGDSIFASSFADTLMYWRQQTHCRTG